MKNNSSFEIPRGRLPFGIQNISKLEARIITKIPEKQTTNSKALDLNDPTPLNSFLLVFIVRKQNLILKKVHDIPAGQFFEIEFLRPLSCS